MRLRTILTVTMSWLALLAIAAALSLVVITTLLHRSTTSLERAMETVRLANELEVRLLVRDRTPPGPSQSLLDASLRERVNLLRVLVDTPDETRQLELVRRDVEQYLTAPPERRGETFTQAIGTLSEFVTINATNARDIADVAMTWDRTGTILGSIVAILLLLGVAGVLVWLPPFAIGPVVRLRQAMRAFSEGDTTARAAEEGPTEVRDIARQFNEMAESIARERERRLSFVGGIAHDLRNPLSALRLALGQMRPERAMPPEATIRRLFATASRQVERLERMVTDLLDVAQLEAGRFTLRREPVDAREIAADVADLFRPAAAASAHDLEVQLPESPVPAMLDRTRLEQVLGNFLSNALKYAPEGSKVRVALEVRDAEALYSVADEGVGMSPEDQARLFAAFQRLDATRAVTSGAGLGLFVARRIVEAHGGRIELESVVGRGSTFRAIVPLGIAHQSAETSAPALH